MKGIIYIRVSSDEQVKGTSLEFQEENCRRYCEQKGIEVIKVFRDEGHSAKTTNREEFLRAIEFCRKNKTQVQAFIVLRLDRFARNAGDHFAIQKILIDYGTTLYSVNENINDGMSGKLIGGILAVVNEYDNAIRTQRTVDGMSSKINGGIFPWKPPPGYICQHVRKRGEKKTKPDPPDPKMFPFIQRSLKEYAKGTYSQVELARLLDIWGLKTLRDKKTTPQFVDRLFGRYLKFYAGIIENPWTGKDIKGQHEAMITEEEMHTIRLVRAGKANIVKRDRYNPLFPLRRTVICHCGRPLTASAPRGNGGKFFYYHCFNKNCPDYGKSIPKLELEKEFIKFIRKITPKGEALTAFKETVLDLWQEKSQEFELEVKKQEKILAEFENTKKKIYEFLENGTYTQEMFKERVEEVENKIAATRISRNEAQLERFDIESTIIYANNFIKDLGRQWFDLAPQLRPRFQKLVFPQGLPYSRINGFGTAKLGLIYELIEQSEGKKSHLVSLRGVEPRFTP